VIPLAASDHAFEFFVGVPFVLAILLLVAIVVWFVRHRHTRVGGDDVYTDE
jgi:hypothetical protein